MQKKLLSLCVATALGAIAAPAFAVGPGDVDAGSNLFIGGATATNRVLGRFLVLEDADDAQQLCAAGGINVFTNRTSRATTLNDLFTTAAGSQYVVMCNGGPSTDFPGEPIAVWKESLGGSGNGVDPVSLQSNLTFLSVGSQTQALLSTGGTSCANTEATNASAFAGALALTQWWNCTGTQSTPPDVGVSDVNPDLLTTNTAVEEDLGPTALGTVDIVFAPIVGHRTYRAMQTLAGLESTCGTDDNGFEPVGSEPAGAPTTQDCDEAVTVPSLTEAQLRAIFTSISTTSNSLQSDAAASLGLGNWFICRRASTSGTQATFESKLLGQRCLPDAVVSSFSAATGAGSTNGCTGPGCAWNTGIYGNDRIFAGFGSADVVSCVTHHDQAGRAVIGILSTETTPGSLNVTALGAGVGAIRYLGINRAVPDLLNAAAGNYPLWTSNTWNKTANITLDPIQDAVQSFIQANLAQPEVVTAINTGFNYGAFQGGILAQSPAFTPVAPPYTRASVTATPVNPNSHSLGIGVQNCAPPMTAGVNTEIGGEAEEDNTAVGEP